MGTEESLGQGMCFFVSRLIIDVNLIRVTHSRNKPWRLSGEMECWASILTVTFSQLGQQICQLYALAAFYLQGNFLVLISFRDWSGHQDYWMWTVGLGHLIFPVTPSVIESGFSTKCATACPTYVNFHFSNYNHGDRVKIWGYVWQFNLKIIWIRGLT